MMWAAFDAMRILAAIALIVLMVVTDAEPTSPLAVTLGTFVVTGLLVNTIRRTSE